MGTLVELLSNPGSEQRLRIGGSASRSEYGKTYFSQNTQGDCLPSIQRPAATILLYISNWRFRQSHRPVGKVHTTGMTSPEQQQMVKHFLDSLCFALAEAYTAGGHVLNPGLSVLTEEAIDDYIVGAVFNIAVNSGWIGPPEQVEEGDGPVLGDYVVKDRFRDGFMSIIAESLAVLRERALESEDEVYRLKQEQYRQRDEQFEALVAIVKSGPRSAADAKGKLDEFFKKSKDVFTFKDLAVKASPHKRKLDGAGVSAVSITRIYNGQYVGDLIRESVARVINELVPCTREDLLPPGRTTPRNRESKR